MMGHKEVCNMSTLDHTDDRVMHHPVPETRGRYDPVLRLVGGK